MTLKIQNWYNLKWDDDLSHFNIIDTIYNDLVNFINKNELTLIINEKEFKVKFINFLYKYSTKEKYKYF